MTDTTAALAAPPKPAATAAVAATPGSSPGAVRQAAADTEPMRMLPHDVVEPSPLNPRKTFDADKIAQLGESIAVQGVLQNLVVRPHPKTPGRYEICAGESRWRAVDALVKAGRLARGTALPCRVKPIDDRTLLELALTENVQRNDLTPLEEAEAYKRLVDMKVGTDDIAKRIGCSRRLVQLRLDLLDRLHPDAREALRANVIPLEHARELTRAPIAAQPSILKELLPAKNGEARLDSAREIRRVVQTAMIPVARALFDRKLYTGEIRVDEATKAECFMDAALFERLQKQALEQRKAELQKKWPWVELKVEKWSHHGLPYGYQEKPKAEKAGALLVYVTESGKLHVYEGVIERDNPKRGGTEPRSYYGAPAKKPAAAKSETFDPVAFDHHVTKIKRNALRLAVVNGGLALTLRLALGDRLGVFEMNGYGGPREANDHPAIRDARRKHLDPLRGHADAALAGRLAKMSERDLAAALATALADEVGVYSDGDGDDAATLALASMFGADVRKVWSFEGKAGESFLALCGAKQLDIIAAQLGLAPAADTKPATLKALRAEILKKAGKDYLPPWLHWRSGADLAKALASATKTPKPASAGNGPRTQKPKTKKKR